jgi:hypothetical protein
MVHGNVARKRNEMRYMIVFIEDPPEQRKRTPELTSPELVIEVSHYALGNRGDFVGELDPEKNDDVTVQKTN